MLDGCKFCLFHFPCVLRLEQFHEVVIGFLSTYFVYLCMHSLIVGGCCNIANDTECDGETFFKVHCGKFLLERGVRAMSIVYVDVIECDAVLTDFHHFESESILHKTIFVVFAKKQFLAVSHIDGVALAPVLGIDGVVATIVEDNAVLQNLAYGSTLMLLCGFKNLYRFVAIVGYRACEKRSTCAKGEFGRTERIFDGTVR